MSVVILITPNLKEHENLNKKFRIILSWNKGNIHDERQQGDLTVKIINGVKDIDILFEIRSKFSLRILKITISREQGDVDSISRIRDAFYRNIINSVDFAII